jgi:hypothetical protein
VGVEDFSRKGITVIASEIWVCEKWLFLLWILEGGGGGGIGRGSSLRCLEFWVHEGIGLYFVKFQGL